MTKRAKNINAFVEHLTDLVVNSMFIKMNIVKPADDSPEALREHEKAKAYVEKAEIRLKGCLAQILENNEEQAEALLCELGIRWTPAASTDSQEDNAS